MEVRIPDSLLYLIFTYLSTQLSYIIFDILFIHNDFGKLIRYSFNAVFVLSSIIWFDKKLRKEFIIISIGYFLLQFCIRYIIIKADLLYYLDPLYIYFYFFLRKYSLNAFIIVISFSTLVLSQFVWQLFTVLIATTIIQFVSRTIDLTQTH
jgi:hypothetical protein